MRQPKRTHRKAPADVAKLVALISQHIGMRLRGLPAAVVKEIYALSLFADAGDSTAAELVFSVNTRAQVDRALRGETAAYGGAAADEPEAKWNYAFWLQEPTSRFLIPPTSEDARLWEELMRTRGIVYSDDDAFDIDRYEKAVIALLVELAIAVSRALHSSGLIRQVFGSAIPVIIHELEYHDGTARWTKSGNPKGVADEFVAWIASQ